MGVVTAEACAMQVEASLEARLVEGCSLGDRQAWRRFHRRYYPVATAFLRKLGVEEGELEDAAQEVFLQVHKYLRRFRQEAELTTWLYRLCVTQARHARRRARVSGMLLRALALTPKGDLVCTQSLSESSARRRIEGALATLSDGERAVFVLYEMEGLAGKQIAAIVKVPEASVWRRLHYARAKFRTALGDELVGAAGGPKCGDLVANAANRLMPAAHALEETSR
jgi:RNA polymerase sigma-70 factor, ECF subfamily